jgi:hypothetical protein
MGIFRYKLEPPTEENASNYFDAGLCRRNGRLVRKTLDFFGAKKVYDRKRKALQRETDKMTFLGTDDDGFMMYDTAPKPKGRK